MIRVLTAINLCANFVIEVYHEVLKHHRTERSVVTRDNELEEGEALRRGVNCFILVLSSVDGPDSEAF